MLGQGEREGGGEGEREGEGEGEGEGGREGEREGETDRQTDRQSFCFLLVPFDPGQKHEAVSVLFWRRRIRVDPGMGLFERRRAMPRGGPRAAGVSRALFEKPKNIRRLFRPFGCSSVVSKIHIRLAFDLICGREPGTRARLWKCTERCVCARARVCVCVRARVRACVRARVCVSLIYD